jgi:hypothetical protein
VSAAMAGDTSATANAAANSLLRIDRSLPQVP